MTKSIALDFDFGDSVYLKTDSEKQGIITGLLVRPEGLVLYEVSWGDRTDSRHYSFELQTEREFKP